MARTCYALTKIRPDAFDGKHWEEAIRYYVR
jgi:hypothetical protein